MQWWQHPVRMMRLDYVDKLERIMDADLDALARSKRDDWHINCEWVIGTPGIAPGLGYMTTFNTPKFEKYPALGEFDLIREYLPYAHKYGIRVIAYLNMHWFSYEFADRHPGWEQMLADGTPYGRRHPLYGDGTTFCVNSGWRDWARELIIECIKTGIDGVFLDGPVIYPGCCYCESCRLLFAERHGGEMPPVEDWTDHRWKEFIEFREDSLAQFLADCRAAVKSVNPEGVIFLNAGSWHAGAWRVARDIEKVGPHEDFNGAEAFFHPGPRNHILHFWSTAAKHLVAGKKPAVVFSHHALGSWHYIPLPPVEAELAIAQTVACGANPWFAVFDYALDHSHNLAISPIKKIQSFLEKNEEYYYGSESAAEVALLYSRQGATFYVSDFEELYGEQGSGREQDLIADLGSGKRIVDWKKRKQICDEFHANSYLGYFTALAREHIPFDVILDSDLTANGLARYKVVILANAACLSDAQIDALKQFVKNGGGIIAEFEAGKYDEKGNRRSTNPLADILGVSDIVEVMAPSVAEEYIKVKAKHPITGRFNLDQLIARPPFSLRTTKADLAESPIMFMNTTGKLYSGLTGESSYPAVIINQVGKGRAVYFPSLVGEFYARYRMWEYQALVSDAVRWAFGSPMPINAECCPASVEIEFRRQLNPPRLLIHLVNNSGDMQRPMSEIIPVYNIRVKLEAENASRIYALWSQQDLDFKRIDGYIEFTIPKVDLYEVIVVE
ncbi:MAG: beta-galactosidase trimerization domain-containing protein [Armatimonadota bacterium]|nr:beta-galactosidase trimerization domain-containing protein [Armatimonadota bacterium]